MHGLKPDVPAACPMLELNMSSMQRSSRWFLEAFLQDSIRIALVLGSKHQTESSSEHVYNLIVLKQMFTSDGLSLLPPPRHRRLSYTGALTSRVSNGTTIRWLFQLC